MAGSLLTSSPLLQTMRQGIDAGCKAEVAICPPYLYLPEVARLLQGSAIRLGAQNMSGHKAGAFTGEVSAAMLRDYHCRFVIIGHSERRTLNGESDAQIA